jgi:hypothetical protein
MRANRTGILLTAAMVFSTDAAAELTEKDRSILDDREAMTQILFQRVSYGYCPIVSSLRGQVSEYVDAWIRMLNYVFQEMPKERWDDSDKAHVLGAVYIWPINDLICFWQKQLQDHPGMDGLDFAFELLARIPQQLPNPHSLLQESGFIPPPSDHRKCKLYDEALNKDCKARYVRIQAVIKNATEEWKDCIQALKILQFNARHADENLGIGACLAFAQDFGEWLHSGEFRWAHWKIFQEQWQWYWRYDVGDLRADFYFIIQFFLIQLGRLPRMIGLKLLPETYEAFCRWEATE